MLDVSIKASSGFSLLELLVATFILAVGMFGIMGVYLHSFRSIEKCYHHTLAVSQLMAESEQR